MEKEVDDFPSIEVIRSLENDLNFLFKKYDLGNEITSALMISWAIADFQRRKVPLERLDDLIKIQIGDRRIWGKD